MRTGTILSFSLRTYPGKLYSTPRAASFARRFFSADTRLVARFDCSFNVRGYEEYRQILILCNINAYYKPWEI